MFKVGDRVRKKDPADDREGVVMDVKDYSAKVLFDKPHRTGTAHVECSWVEFADLNYADRLA